MTLTPPASHSASGSSSTSDVASVGSASSAVFDPAPVPVAEQALASDPPAPDVGASAPAQALAPAPGADPAALPERVEVPAEGNTPEAASSEAAAAEAPAKPAPTKPAKPVGDPYETPEPKPISTLTDPLTPLCDVAFVGTGPGDRGLITVRAVEFISAADVIILDRLLTPEDLKAWTKPGVEFLESVNAEGVALTPAACARLVARAARKGRRVIRLIDGDPSVFSNLADEARACRKAELEFEVVPGISAHTAVPVYAGVPLTTRTTRAVHVITPTDVRVDWAKSTGQDVTVVLQGPYAVVANSLDSLLQAGRNPSCPVAVILGGTTPDQQTSITTLEEAPEYLRALVSEQALLVVVGDPIKAREELSWFDTKPLFGWRVLVPRTKDQAGSTTDRLTEFGAISRVVPTISVEPPRTPQQMERSIKGLVTGRYEWVGFTSVNAVRAVRERFEELGLDARAFSGLKVAAVGGVTADSLREWGIDPDLVPETDQSASGLLEVWPPFDDVLDPINRVFLPRADIATDVLVAGLQEIGWEVDDVTAYRTVRAAPPAAEVRDAIKSGKFDAVVFTSSSTVRNLVGIAGKPHPTTVVACIGPATAQTALDNGLRVDVQSEAARVESLVDALAEFGAQMRADSLAAGEPVLRPSQRRPPARRKSR